MGGCCCSSRKLQFHGTPVYNYVYIKQSIFLIASNAAAVLPAYWALRNKAFAEWVLTRRVASLAHYIIHATSEHDFRLSFMAVVSTFVYLASISEVSKRTIHTILAIVTALLAETGPTRSKNISYVIALGTLGLLVGWNLEFCARNRTFSFSTEFHLNLLARWEIIKVWFHNIIKTIIKRFRWGFIIAGLAALAMAAVSWKMESTQNYSIWHSLWHIFIDSSSFLFLCSKANTGTCESDGPSDGSYELTRQNSLNGGEERLER